MPSRMTRDVPTRNDPVIDPKKPHEHYSYDVRDTVDDDVDLPPTRYRPPSDEEDEVPVRRGASPVSGDTLPSQSDVP